MWWPQVYWWIITTLLFDKWACFWDKRGADVKVDLLHYLSVMQWQFVVPLTTEWRIPCLWEQLAGCLVSSASHETLTFWDDRSVFAWKTTLRPSGVMRSFEKLHNAAMNKRSSGDSAKWTHADMSDMSDEKTHHYLLWLFISMKLSHV